MICLDTSFLITALAPGESQDLQLRGWLANGEMVRINVIAWAEFLCGPVSSEQIAAVHALISEPIPLIAEDAARGAERFNATGRRRGSLADCLIAATCIRYDAALATNNVSDFGRFQPMGLRIAPD